MKKNKIAIIVTLFTVSLGLSSCGFFGEPENPLYGTWTFTDYEEHVTHTANFKSKGKFTLKQERHRAEETEEGNNYFHHYETYSGTYDYSDEIVTLHYSEVEYRDVSYINHEKEEKIETKKLSYDEKAKFEIVSNGNQMKLTRNFGTDSEYIQIYDKQKIK